jgi:hypothetical protein
MEVSTSRGEQHSKPLGIPAPSRKLATPLARKRQHNRLMRELASEYGIETPTTAERALLAQAATIILRIESASTKGEAVDSDTLIRLSGEARRVLAGLRRRKARHVPLRERLAAEAA